MAGPLGGRGGAGGTAWCREMLKRHQGVQLGNRPVVRRGLICLLVHQCHHSVAERSIIAPPLVVPVDVIKVHQAVKHVLGRSRVGNAATKGCVQAVAAIPQAIKGVSSIFV